MGIETCVQLTVRSGDRVQILLHELCRKAGGGKLYPDGGTGTVQDCVVGDKNHGHCNEREKVAYTVYDMPFVTSVTENGKEKVMVIGADWIPVWLLVRLPEPKPETD